MNHRVEQLVSRLGEIYKLLKPATTDQNIARLDSAGLTVDTTGLLQNEKADLVRTINEWAIQINRKRVEKLGKERETLEIELRREMLDG